MADPWVRREVIGDCVLYQGDCLEVVPLIGKVDAVVTDPPYGMSFQSNHRIVSHKRIANDCGDELLQWACRLEAPHSKYVWMRWDNIADIPMPRSLITWVKNNHSMGDLDHEHGRKTEVCAFYKGPDHFFPSGRPTDVITGTRTGNEFHPTQKPVDLMRNVVEWTSGVVCDPFMGSGTTLVACAKLGRKGIGIELDSDYFDIACRRVEEAYRQPDLFVAPPAPAVQEGFDL
jgi:site-specific DNA-methyltransferase (adenine-specific)